MEPAEISLLIAAIAVDTIAAISYVYCFVIQRRALLKYINGFSNMRRAFLLFIACMALIIFGNLHDDVAWIVMDGRTMPPAEIFGFTMILERLALLICSWISYGTYNESQFRIFSKKLWQDVWNE